MVLRYTLQRGFLPAFSSSSGAHLQKNLQALSSIELNASAMMEMACWRGEDGCDQLAGAVGAQPTDDSARRHYRGVHGSVDLARGEVASVDLAAGETDPTRPPFDQLRAALELAPACRASRPLGSILALQAANDQPRCAAISAQRCHFGLELAEPAAFDAQYTRLVGRLSLKAGNALGEEHLTTRLTQSRNGAKAQHVVTINRTFFRSHLPELKELENQYVRPYLQRRVLGAAPPRWKSSIFVSRNMNDFNETRRMASMLWHFDGNAKPWIKVILYLNDVTNANGCMVAMERTGERTGERAAERQRPADGSGERTATGRTLRDTSAASVMAPSIPVRGAPAAGGISARRPFKVDVAKFQEGGSFGNPGVPNLPRTWVAQLESNGYEAKCLAAPKGTMVVFDTNIVHRGSRPAEGHHRDFVLWQFDH